MADDTDDQDDYGGLAQDLLGRPPMFYPAGLASVLGQPPLLPQPVPSGSTAIPQVVAIRTQPPMAGKVLSGDYATVADYQEQEPSSGLGSLFDTGHLGISINGGPAYGLEPTPGIGSIPAIRHEPWHPLQTATQLFGIVPGELDLIPANRPIGDKISFPVSHDAAQTMEQYLRGMAGPTLYNVPFKDCVTTVADTMKSAHLNAPSTLTNLTPAQFVRALHALYDKPAVPPQ